MIQCNHNHRSPHHPLEDHSAKHNTTFRDYRRHHSPASNTRKHFMIIHHGLHRSLSLVTIMFSLYLMKISDTIGCVAFQNPSYGSYMIGLRNQRHHFQSDTKQYVLTSSSSSSRVINYFGNKLTSNEAKIKNSLLQSRIDISKQQQRRSFTFRNDPTYNHLDTSLSETRDSNDMNQNDGIDDDNKKNIIQIPLVIWNFIKRRLDSGRIKFQQRPGTYLLIPCIAALVGWFTNWLAVQMLFYPINYWGINIWRRPEVPLGLIGWQGIVPCKTIPMTTAIVDMVTSQLISVSEVFYRLNPIHVANILSPEIPKIMNDIVMTEMKQYKWIYSTPKVMQSWFKPIIDTISNTFVQQLTVSLQQNANNVFNIQNCVVNQMVLNRSKLGELFQSVAQAELNFLTNSGLWFGFMLGLIQMFIALVYDNPWTLSFGGLIVGLATNWLALKWIFQPIDPTKFGPFILQGQFLRRQKEVAALFSNYFSTNVLTSNEIWKSILNDPTTKPQFLNVLTEQIHNTMKQTSRWIPASIVSQIPLISQKIMDRLPNHIPVIFPYMDSALNLETTLRIKMELMTSRRFERVLHPIFEEDELTLIISGAVLGFIAGLIQQGLETGAIKIPNIIHPIKQWIKKKLPKRYIKKIPDKEDDDNIDPEESLE